MSDPFATSVFDAEDFFDAGNGDIPLGKFDDLGAKYAGVLVDIEKKAGKFKAEPFPWLTLDQGDDGLVKIPASSWAMQRALLTEIKAHGGKIALGATISIEYSGDTTLSNGMVAKEYTVTYAPAGA